MSPELRNGPYFHYISNWTVEEDEELKRLVQRYGAKDWKEIALKLQEANLSISRKGKQCRERWVDYVSPNVRKGKWTSEEDATILKGHALNGKKWSVIAKAIPGRTDNSIKNRRNYKLNKEVGTQCDKML